jgi:hypothetical protein
VQRFVFLEFTDERLRSLLSSLRAALQGSESATPVHVTVRGPYSELPHRELLEDLEERIAGLGVVVGGAGMFQARQPYTVYLKAQSPLFQEVWWKRDFPTDIFGMTPHITMFETRDLTAAKAVHRFLKNERIEIFTLAVRLSVYASKQMILFPVEEVRKRQRNVALHVTNIGRWHVKPGILSRARALSSSLRSKTQNGD